MKRLLDYIFGPAYREVPNDYNPMTDSDYRPNQTRFGVLIAFALVALVFVVYAGLTVRRFTKSQDDAIANATATAAAVFTAESPTAP